MENSQQESIIEQMEEWTQYTEEFKNDAVSYWKEHPELGIAKCAKNLGAFSNGRKYMMQMKGQSWPGEGGILRVMSIPTYKTACHTGGFRHLKGILGKWQRLSSWRLPGIRAASGRGEASAKCLWCAENLRCFKKRIPFIEKRLPSNREKRKEQIENHWDLSRKNR